MNPEVFPQIIQKGFRTTLGATTALFESLQDTRKFEENLNKLQADPNQFADELADKGEVTEREARTFVEQIFTTVQQGGAPANSATVTTTAKPVANGAMQTELQELTQQIIELRQELDKLKSQGSE